jgi:hypothetical protein
MLPLHGFILCKPRKIYLLREYTDAKKGMRHKIKSTVLLIDRPRIIPHVTTGIAHLGTPLLNQMLKTRRTAQNMNMCD